MGIFDRFFGPPDKDKFARLLTRAIRQAGDKSSITYDANEFRLLGEGKHVFNLGNVYREYCSTARARRHELLRRYVRTWFAHLKEIPREFDDAKPDLLPVVRNRSYFEFFRLQAEIDGLGAINWPHRVIADDFAVGLVYDLPDSIAQIQQDRLTEWGVSFDDALDVACANLREISHNPFVAVAPGVWTSPWRDNHDAGRFMLPDLIRTIEVDGDHIAMVPNRDTLLIAGSDDEHGLAAMASLAEKAMEQPRPFNLLAFRLQGDDWQSYLPDANQPLFDRFRRLRVMSIGQDYAEQKPLLEARHQKTGEDIFVASFSSISKKGSSRIRSYSVWSKGVDTLLPQTDLVYFFVAQGKDKGDVVATGEWEQVQQALGHLMKPQSLYPERFRVQEFPTPEQLEAITTQ